MKIELIDQPSGELLHARLGAHLLDQSTTAVFVASAWVRRPGIALIKPELSKQTARLPANAVRGLFGVDLGGTTKEGLESAMEAFGRVKVFHSPGTPRRSFHPKVYVVERDRTATVCIGSANLTYGGIGANFEAVTCVTLDTSLHEDTAFLQSVRDWFDGLWTDSGAAFALSLSSLKTLLSDRSVWVPTENEARQVLSKPGGKRSTVGGAPSVFSRVKGLPAVPKLPRAPSSPESLEDEQPITVVEGIALEDLVTPDIDAELRVLLAYVPHDRWNQIGFNKMITGRFFRVFTNGDLMWIEGVKQDGSVLRARTTTLVNPTITNQNHRIELPEPDGRPDPKPERGAIVVLERSLRTFRYIHLRPGDAAYSAMTAEIASREKFGQHNAPSTKRVLISYGELVHAWPGACPIKP